MDDYENDKESTIVEAGFNSYFNNIDLSQYGTDNFFRETTNLLDSILDTAITNMNKSQGANMKIEDLRQLVNITIKTNALGSMRSLTYHNLEQIERSSVSMFFGIEAAMSDAIKYAEQNQNQTMGL
jgi:hypothetical protein